MDALWADAATDGKLERKGQGSWKFAEVKKGGISGHGAFAMESSHACSAEKGNVDHAIVLVARGEAIIRRSEFILAFILEHP